MESRSASEFMNANIKTSPVSAWVVMHGIHPFSSNFGANWLLSSTCSTEVRAAKGISIGAGFDIRLTFRAKIIVGLYPGFNKKDAFFKKDFRKHSLYWLNRKAFDINLFENCLGLNFYLKLHEVYSVIT